MLGFLGRGAFLALAGERLTVSGGSAAGAPFSFDSWRTKACA